MQEQRRRINAYNREVDRVNKANQKAVDDFNRRLRRAADDANRQEQRRVDAYNRHVTEVNSHNQKVDAHNRTLISSLARRSPRVVFTQDEQQLADRVQQVLMQQDDREYDVFVSYAHIDGADVARQLTSELRYLGVRVWMDDVMALGQGMARQMDRGLVASRCGVAVLTPAYVTGRFWTERELGVLLHKATLIPVAHNVSFAEIAKYSGFLGDLVGLSTHQDAVPLLAQKIAAIVLPNTAAA